MYSVQAATSAEGDQLYGLGLAGEGRGLTVRSDTLGQGGLTECLSFEALYTDQHR